jgi:hypothetical protein
MAYYDTTWYTNAGDQSTTGHYAVAKRPQNAAVAAGQLVRQFTAPAVNSERVFICIVAGTTANTTDATWTLTRGAKSTDGTATWQEVTGIAAVNGDLTNTVNWTQAKAIGTPTLGTIIQRNSGASYWICSTAGTLGASEPAWPNNTAGTTQADGTTTWTCLGVVGNFTGGQAPHARLLNAATTNWFAFGNTIYVGDNHAESQSAPNMNISVAGSVTLMSRILCHNHSGSYPPAVGDLTTGATISSLSFATLSFSLSNGGSFYFYGITFKAGSGTSGSTVYFSVISPWTYFDRCSFQLPSTGAGNTIQFGSNSSTTLGMVIWNNCTVYFGNTGDSISLLLSQFLWQNTGQVLASGSSVPTSLIAANSSSGGQQNNITLEALDLSQLTGNLFSASQQNWINLLIKDCKLNASSAIQTPPNNSGLPIQLVRCDSGATGYKSARYAYEGVETTDTTVTRVGGAADPTGQAQSRKIVTTANSQWLRPFKAEPYAIWNPTTGANVTVTVCGAALAGSLPNNDDIWLEVEYLGSSASPLGTIVTTTKSNVLAANAAVASDGSTWNYTTPNTTLNPADKEAHISLSGGNLTALGTAGWGGFVRAVDAQSSGKYYWEYTFNAAVSNTGVGVILGTLSLTTASGFAAAFNGQVGLVQSGSVYVDGSTSITIGGVGGSSPGFPTITSGTIICVAIDLTAKLIWFRLGAAGNWNNNSSRNPATGTGGISITNVTTAYPTIFFNGADTVIANFGSSAFTGAVPSGFTSGFPAAFTLTPFKLTTTLSSPQPGMAGYLHARVRAAKASTTWYIDPQVTLS